MAMAERMEDVSQSETIGYAEESRGLITSIATIDVGWVSNESGWTPQPYINGYSNGTLSVPAKWGGLDEVPQNCTVCRYGIASGGPYCGKVAQQGATVQFQLDTQPTYADYLNVTRVSGSCADDGDSGGPHLSDAGFIQGTTIGADTTNTCNSSTTNVYFQPIQDHLGEFGLTMLTVHGANAPTVSGLVCPDSTLSGSGIYYCKIDHYNSQGSASMSWTSSTSHSSSTTELYGSCTIGHPVTVSLAVTNQYGTGYSYSSFTCPN
jgi:streptogrisin C